MKKLAVFCGSSLGFNVVYRNEAIKLGNYFVKNNIAMVYGGGKIGMMGTIANTILAQKGEVVGVIPNLLRHEEVAHDTLTEMIVTKTMSKRKIAISKLVDGYIALPGGYGTIDEIFEALTLNQLGIEQKPVALLNTNGYFDNLIKQLDVMEKEGFLNSENKKMLLVSDSVPTLMQQIKSYIKPTKTEIISKVVNNEKH